ncbi:MAG TPA: peptidase M16 [Flavobacteriales bacterium]|nr:peptidase M16 [Flavobacteriales bacterium]
MKSALKFLTGALFIVPMIFVSCSSESETSKWKYEEVENDPLQTRIYKLENGLTVYLSLNKDKPRVQTNIAVRAGSKYDPAETTGLAHYLEHMLFKGNSQIASMDWEKEKVLLGQISDLYEDLRASGEDEMKNEIYRKIDSVSQEAAHYVVPNEYDKMISSLGAQGTNAYTSDERTVYINDIPSNEMEKWMQLESVRFSELTLRLFHTELEAVYEEFNRSQDSDYRKQYYAMLELLFPTHQYGTQTTIGTGEHLKNPSMVKIHEYFDTYYVPNNMAIILAGDIDYDETIEMINKYFGSWAPKELPTYIPPKEEEITSVRSKEVFGPNAEKVSLAYRFDGSDSKDALYLKMIDGVLSNGKAGLIDINLIQKQEVLEAYSSARILKDYSYLYFNASPKEGQSLDEAKDLLIAQIEHIKNGEFEDWLPEAVVNNFKLSEMRFAESNNYRAYMLTDAFILEKSWADIVKTNDVLSLIKKQDLMKFAQERFGDNYAVVYKRTGKDTTIYKVDKPQITPVDINRENQSLFAQHFDSLPEKRLEPIFLDFDKDIYKAEYKPGIPYYSIKNETNELFQVIYVLEMGNNHDLSMGLAIDYLPFLGTSEYSAEELSKEFFKLGVDFGVYSGDDRTYVHLSGLQQSMDKGLSLFESLLKDPQPDDEALGKLISNKLKERDDNKKEKYYIHRGAMQDYGKYGKDNPFKHILSKDELMAVKATDLTDKIKQITSFEHLIFYYGPEENESVLASLHNLHQTPSELMPYPEEKIFPELDNTENLVYFVDYDMVQTELLMISKSQSFNTELLPKASIFNEYFGAGLSSIVFQEIRESKALAYSAYAYYSSPSRKENSHYIQAYIGTQTNKLGQATDAIIELLNNMPEAQGQFEDAKLTALKQIETNRITKSNIFWTYYNNKKKGIDYDIRSTIYEDINKMQMSDLKAFFDQNIKGRNFSYLVIGNRSEVDFESLKKLGKVHELSLEEVFGY